MNINPKQAEFLMRALKEYPMKTEARITPEGNIEYRTGRSGLTRVVIMFPYTHSIHVAVTKTKVFK